MKHWTMHNLQTYKVNLVDKTCIFFLFIKFAKFLNNIEEMNKTSS